MRLRSRVGLLGAVALGLLCVQPACAPTTGDLVRAAAQGDLALARKCVESGVDVNRPSRYGFRRENEGDTPLTTAVQFGSREVVEFLIAHGADVNLGFGGRIDGTSPLSSAGTLGRVEIARILIGAGARVDARDGQGMSPLAYAVSRGNLDVADVLIGAGAVPDFAVFRAVLEYGAPPRRIEMVRFLLSQGLDPNGRDSEGRSFLSHAERKGLAEIVALLRSSGARE